MVVGGLVGHGEAMSFAGIAALGGDEQQQRATWHGSRPGDVNLDRFCEEQEGLSLPRRSSVAWSWWWRRGEAELRRIEEARKAKLRQRDHAEAESRKRRARGLALAGVATWQGGGSAKGREERGGWASRWRGPGGCAAWARYCAPEAALGRGAARWQEAGPAAGQGRRGSVR